MTPQAPVTHNLFGDLGPRCPRCSGLGRIILLGSSGRPTKSSSPCSCRGTGIDLELQREHEFQRLQRECDRLQREYMALRTIVDRLPPNILNSRQYWEELVAWTTADGTPVANTTTEAIIFPNITLPANYMQDGRSIRIRAFGKLSTTATPTMTWALRWGGVSGTLLATSEAITMGSTVTNVNWGLEVQIQTRANGAAGSLLVFGDLTVHTGVTTTISNIFGVSGYDAPAAVTADLTADVALALTADWSAANAANTLTGMIYNLESQN